jgi:hypothetical protein
MREANNIIYKLMVHNERVWNMKHFVITSKARAGCRATQHPTKKINRGRAKQ